MDNEWKNSLRERFSDYSVPEPEGLWEGIEQGIAGKKRRKMLPVWLVTGLAAAAAVALVVFLRPAKTVETPVDTVERYVQDLTSDTPDASTSSASEESITVAEPVEATGTKPVEATGSKPSSFAVVSRRPLLAEATPAEDSDKHLEELLGKLGLTEDDLVHICYDASKKQPDPITETPELIVDETSGYLAYDEAKIMEALQGELSDPIPPSRFSVGAYRIGGQEASEQSQGFGLSRTKGPYFTRSSSGGKKQDTGSLMSMLAANKASSFEAHHGAPVRVGVTVAWELTPHLSLTSGLDWTSLTSTFDETASGMRNYTRQNLGYLGIPLRLEAGLRPWKGLRLYAGAGGMVEKGLMANATTSSYIGDYLEETTSSHPDTGGLLWSLGASAGAEYRFNRLFSIYFAPGIEYHFDNGSAVKSAYTEKPLHWNMALGVRFNFQK